MAKRQSTTIPPFPDHIDRDYFGAYLSGLTDGEGCFHLGMRKKNRDCRAVPGTWFRIDLRRDDESILRLIQSYLGCGYIKFRRFDADTLEKRPNGKPIVMFGVERLSDLMRLIEHFDAYPLLAKKRRDFEIWKAAVQIQYAVHQRPNIHLLGRNGMKTKWRDSERERYIALANEIRRVRAFSEEIRHPEIEPPPDDAGEMPLFDRA